MPTTDEITRSGVAAWGGGAFGLNPLPPPSAVGSGPANSAGSAGDASPGAGGFSPTVGGWIMAALVLLAIRIAHERYGARLE
jgi:hypothetical protein